MPFHPRVLLALALALVAFLGSVPSAATADPAAPPRAHRPAGALAEMVRASALRDWLPLPRLVRRSAAAVRPAWDIPDFCGGSSVSVADDTQLRSAIAGSGDDSVICITQDIDVLAPYVIDDTTLTISGVNETVTLHGQGHRIFNVDYRDDSTDMLILSSLTFSGAHSTDDSGAALHVDGGGPGDVFRDLESPQVLLLGTRFTGNSTAAGIPGGAVAISNAYAMSVLTAFEDNSSGGDAGAVYVDHGAFFFGFPLGASWGLNAFASNTAAGDGGAIAGRESLLLAFLSVFDDNHAVGSGGAIAAEGDGITVSLLSEFIDNSADSGGAIWSDDSVGLLSSVLEGNDAVTAGGAIATTSEYSVESTSLVNNGDDTAPTTGGALWSTYSGASTIVNSTIASNHAVGGGSALVLAGDDTIDVTTITGNDGGGPALLTSGRAFVTNSILAANTSSGDDSDLVDTTAGTLSSLAFTLVSSAQSVAPISLGAGPGMRFGDPQLGPLGDNGGSLPLPLPGGFLPTMLPTLTSPAIGAGQVSLLPPDVTDDQRGFSRTSNNGRTLTLGAVEVAGPAPTTSPSSPPRDVMARAGDRSLAVTWVAPSDPGSFAVSDYLATASPSGRTCLVSVPATSCTISGLTNGTSYAVTVQALTGAGWSKPSAPSSATPHVAATILITGARGTGSSAGRVFVDGTSTGLVGATVTPWVRLPGQIGFSEGTAVPRVDAAGRFAWSRASGKKVSVLFAHGPTRSNVVTIPAK